MNHSLTITKINSVVLFDLAADMTAYARALGRLIAAGELSGEVISCPVRGSQNGGTALYLVRKLFEKLAARLAVHGFRPVARLRARRDNRALARLNRALAKLNTDDQLGRLLARRHKDFERQFDRWARANGQSFSLLVVRDFQRIPADGQPAAAGLLHRLVKGTSARFRILSLERPTLFKKSERGETGVQVDHDYVETDLRKYPRLPVLSEHTLLLALGSIRGRSVLELACRDGTFTRKLKQLGAARTVGIEAPGEMLDAAIEQEARAPLGIEYVQGEVLSLGLFGAFDLVTAVHVLDYASSVKQLAEIGRAVFERLAPGGRLLAVVGNPDNRGSAYPPDTVTRLGFGRAQDGGSPGGAARSKPDTSQVVRSDRSTYEWALREAGFERVRWHRLLLPPEIERRDGAQTWAAFLEASPAVVIEAFK